MAERRKQHNRPKSCTAAKCASWSVHPRYVVLKTYAQKGRATDCCSQTCRVQVNLGCGKSGLLDKPV